MSLPLEESHRYTITLLDPGQDRAAVARVLRSDLGWPFDQIKAALDTPPVAIGQTYLWERQIADKLAASGAAVRVVDQRRDVPYHDVCPDGCGCGSDQYVTGEQTYLFGPGHTVSRRVVPAIWARWVNGEGIG